MIWWPYALGIALAALGLGLTVANEIHVVRRARRKREIDRMCRDFFREGSCSRADVEEWLRQRLARIDPAKEDS